MRSDAFGHVQTFFDFLEHFEDFQFFPEMFGSFFCAKVLLRKSIRRLHDLTLRSRISRISRMNPANPATA